MPLDTGPTPSVFDPEWQHTNPDAKLIAAVERISQAFRVLLWQNVKEAPGDHALTPAQIQALVFLLYHDERLARVGEIAREFMLTPATVSDAVSALERKGLVDKVRSNVDRRSFVLRLTKEGERVARDLAGWADPVVESLGEISAERKTVVLRVLLDLIAALQDRGIVQSTRMCLTCRYFGEHVHADASKPHHCNLLDRPLAPADLRIDCPEHEPAAG